MGYFVPEMRILELLICYGVNGYGCYCNGFLGAVSGFAVIPDTGGLYFSENTVYKNIGELLPVRFISKDRLLNDIACNTGNLWFPLVLANTFLASTSPRVFPMMEVNIWSRN
jgi:hypothetical protein